MKHLMLAAVAAAVPASAHALQDADFQSASRTIQEQGAEAVERLAALRQEVADSLLPLAERLRELERDAEAARAEFAEVKRTEDSREVELDNLEEDLRASEQQAQSLSNLFSGYASNFESRLHISELQRYQPLFARVRAAEADPETTPAELYALHAEVLETSLGRIDEALGGTRFAGTAVDDAGLVEQGTFALVGPLALFRSDSGLKVGMVEQPLNSLEPTLVPFEDPERAAAAETLIATGSGVLPTDPTLGNAQKLAQTEQTVLEEIEKGGLVIIPIFVMAGLALLMALYRWIGLTFTRMPRRKKVEALLEAVGRRDADAAEAVARSMRGPAGKMLTAGAQHLGEPTELIEEVMYERLLTSKLKLNALLPFISICAAAAPLLGLLGTVTGIIRTFQMITLYGSGDVKTLSGGISEALITTKYGLVVAIPSLLLHAFLSRKARGIVARMETVAMSFVNRVGVAYGSEAKLAQTELHPKPDPQAVRDQVQAILGEMLGDDVDTASATPVATNR